MHKLLIIQDPKLKRLAAALPSSVLHCKVMSTTKKYLGSYKWWEKDHRIFSVEPMHLALYLQHLAELQVGRRGSS